MREFTPGSIGGARVPSGVDLNTLTLPGLYKTLSSTGLVRRLLELARDEDLGPAESPWRGQARPATHGAFGGDITTAACVDPATRARVTLATRSDGVAAGLECVDDLLDVFARGCLFAPAVKDCDTISAGMALGVLEGPLDEILEVERTLLNLLGRLCGVATQTAMYRRAMEGAGTVRAGLYDTRKTTPGLRVLEKYAVRCGGGFCHRIGLYDAVLMKDNHLAGVGVGDLAAFVAKATARALEMSGAKPPAFVEVEVDSLDQFLALLTLPAGTLDIVLLDNMGPAELSEAVRLRDATLPRLQLEASGGVTLETIGAIARTGVDRISVGALTHGARCLDLGLDIVGG